MSDTVRIESRRVGPVEVAEGDLIHFDGLPGFPDARRFVVMEHAAASAFSWLVSMDDPDLAFVIANPWHFFPSYSPALPEAELEKLGIEKESDLEVVTIVTLDGKAVYLNLSAPLLINGTTRRGLQLLTDDRRYTTHAAIPKLNPTLHTPNSGAQHAQPGGGC